MPDEKKREKTNWVLVGVTVAVGLLLLGSGIFTDLVWKWEPIITGTLTSIGAAFLLAFVIFLMDRNFTRTITRQVDQSAREIVAENTEQLSNRLSDLEGQLREQRESTRRRQDDIIEHIDDDVSYQTITAALDLATSMGAINQGLTVPGSLVDPRLLVTFRFGPRFSGRASRPFEEGTAYELTVSVEAERRAGDIGRPYVGVEWLPTSAAAEVNASLDQSLRGDGRISEAKSLDLAHAVGELRRVLRIVMDDQHAATGTERLRGQLREALQGGWFITSEGLHNLDTGYLATPDELGLRPKPQRPVSNFSMTPPQLKAPAPPPGVDQSYWEFVFERAKNHLSEPLRI